MNSKQNGQHAKSEDFAAKRKRLKRTVVIGAGALVVVVLVISVLFVATGGNMAGLMPLGFDGTGAQDGSTVKDTPEQSKELPAHDLAIAGQNPGGRNVAPGAMDTGGMGTPYPMENLVNMPLIFKGTITDIETFGVVPLYDDPYDRCLITVRIEKMYSGDQAMVGQSKVIFCSFDGFIGSYITGTLIAIGAESVFFYW